MAACTRHNYRRECQPEDVARALAGVRLARLRLETERGLKEATRKGMN